MPLTPGTRLGSYEITSLLGSGGMGDVWLARHRALARPAAIKLIRPDVISADAGAASRAMRRFEREAAATAKLRAIMPRLATGSALLWIGARRPAPGWETMREAVHRELRGPRMRGKVDSLGDGDVLVVRNMTLDALENDLSVA